MAYRHSALTWWWSRPFYFVRPSPPYSYHYGDVIMGAIASQITSVSIVSSTVCPVTDQRKHQSSASLGFVRGIHRWPVDSPYKGPVTKKMFPFDDVIMMWMGIGVITKVMVTLNHVGGSFIFSVPPPGYLNNPIFSNLRLYLCVACWAHFFMCHHELGQTSMSPPFPSLIIAL